MLMFQTGLRQTSLNNFSQGIRTGSQVITPAVVYCNLILVLTGPAPNNY